MNEPVKNPFDILVEQFRAVVREEIEEIIAQHLKSSKKGGV
jgi:hypothetical protein